MASQLAGAWESADDDYKGLFVFTDTHYSHAFMQTGRTNFQDEANPTDAEAADAYKTMRAGAGTYSFEGNRLTAKCQGRWESVPAGRSETVPMNAAAGLSEYSSVLKLGPRLSPDLG